MHHTRMQKNSRRQFREHKRKKDDVYIDEDKVKEWEKSF